MNADGTDPRRIAYTQQHYGGHAGWSHDGRFVSYEGPNGIHVIDMTDGSKVDSGDRTDWEADWAPDRDRLVFVHDTDIYAMNADATDLERLTETPHRLERWPIWSPDGSRIAYFAVRENGSGLFVLDLKKMSEVQLSGEECCYGRPDWSADGQLLAFASDNGDIWIVGADGSGLTNITPGDRAEYEARWEPSGTRIAFARPGLWTMQSDGTDKRRLVSGVVSDIMWSVDGTRLLFARGRDVYVTDPAGRGRANLTNTSRYEDQPKLSPDGNRIVFLRGRTA